MGVSKGHCIHFTGVQNKTCKAGLSYDAFQRPNFPCIKEFNHGGAVCEKYQEPTQQEIDEWRVKVDASMNRMQIVHEHIHPWRKKWKGKGHAEVIECPICHGKLHLTIAALNGHVHGRCETKECVSWME